MPSNCANPSIEQRQPLDVLFVIYPNIVLLDLAGPLQVFSGARHPVSGERAYRTAIASLNGGDVASDTGVTIASEPIQHWTNKELHTLVIVGGNGANEAMHDSALIECIRTVATRSQRVCSVCSGALILAAAGLLRGRRATTHWDDCDHLQREFIDVHVERDPIYINDGPVWTSAGITAGIDMSLAMVSADLGSGPALELAQSLLSYMVRPGGQSQFSPALQRQWKDRAGKFDALHVWLEDNLQADIRIEDMASQANMSLRNFYRHYSQQMGMTPAKALELMRIERARTLLETSDAGIKTVAVQSGFGDEERMRRAFVKATGISPSSHRNRFQIG